MKMSVALTQTSAGAERTAGATWQFAWSSVWPLALLTRKFWDIFKVQIGFPCKHYAPVKILFCYHQNAVRHLDILRTSRKSLHWVIPEKIQTGLGGRQRLSIWNFPNYWISSIWKFDDLIKGELGFPGLKICFVWNFLG